VSSYRKLAKTAVKSDRWLSSVDGSLKAKPKKFWNYVSAFSRNKSNLSQISVDGTHLPEPCQIAEAFARHFKSVYSNTASVFPPIPIISFDASSLHNLPQSPVIDADVRKAIRQLKPSKSFGLDGIPGFAIKGCTETLYLYLRIILTFVSGALATFLQSSCYFAYFFRKGSNC
jgi:hypothetical protein